MRKIIKKTYLPFEGSFTVSNQSFPHLSTPLHYHPEYEFVFQTKGYGKRIIGDNSSPFEEGDIVFIYKNTPQLWISAPEYYKKDSNLIAGGIILNFSEDCLGKDFFDLHEMQHISHFLKNSSNCYQLRGKLKKSVGKKLFEMVDTEGAKRVILFLSILDEISLAKNSNLFPLVSNTYQNNTMTYELKKMDKAISYISNNYYKKINLADVAPIMGLTPSAFSRVFKQKTKKTFKDYLIECRISYAKKLLIETDFTILHICFETGFNNVSNFIRQFKRITQTTPSSYRKNFLRQD